jgi:hypothetical protein
MSKVNTTSNISRLKPRNRPFKKPREANTNPNNREARRFLAALARKKNPQDEADRAEPKPKYH